MMMLQWALQRSAAVCAIGFFPCANPTASAITCSSLPIESPRPASVPSCALPSPVQEQQDERGGGAGPLQDVSNGAHRMNSSAVAVRKQRAHGGAKRSRSGGVIAPAPKQ